jgi:uncharacterized protein (DUF433 family)
MSTIAETHVRLDENGVAWIDDTKVKVIEVAIDKLAHGSSPEEMHLQYPHISLAQIHAALTYYYDHQQGFDAEIARQLQEVGELRAKAEETPLHTRLRSLGWLRECWALTGSPCETCARGGATAGRRRCAFGPGGRSGRTRGHFNREPLV